MVPAPITAMVLTSMRLVGSSFRNFLIRFFVEAQHNPLALYDYWPPNQVRFPGHQLNRFGACGRMPLHVAFPVELVAWVQKLLVVALSNQLIKLGRGQPLFI